MTSKKKDLKINNDKQDYDTVKCAFEQELKQLVKERHGSFSVGASFRTKSPELDINGFGNVSLPLQPNTAQQLIKHCKKAPYGRKEETLWNDKVRDTWQLEPSQIKTSKEWITNTLKTLAQQVTTDLGVATSAKLELYKLLLYEKGGHFVPHRDTEKAPGMFATLVVNLPSVYTGGELIVKHDMVQHVYDFSKASGSEYHYISFYADCQHEVKPITSGYRLCLVYNVIYAGSNDIPYSPSQTTEEVIDLLSKVVKRWNKEANPRRLIYLLKHQYTEAEFSFHTLKGPDRAVANVLDTIRDQGLEPYLAFLKIHETGGTDLPYDQYSYSKRRRYHYDNDSEDEKIDPNQCKMINGEKKITAERLIRFDTQNQLEWNQKITIDSKEALYNFIDNERLLGRPDEASVEEATGNAGATMDRWYKRAVIVMWPSEMNLHYVVNTNITLSIEILSAVIIKEQKQKYNQKSEEYKKAIQTLKTHIREYGSNLNSSQLATEIIGSYSEDYAKYGGHQWVNHHKLPLPPIPHRKSMFAVLKQIDRSDLAWKWLIVEIGREKSLHSCSVEELFAICSTLGWETCFEQLYNLCCRNTSVMELLLIPLCTPSPSSSINNNHNRDDSNNCDPKRMEIGRRIIQEYRKEIRYDSHSYKPIVSALLNMGDLDIVHKILAETRVDPLKVMSLPKLASFYRRYGWKKSLPTLTKIVGDINYHIHREDVLSYLCGISSVKNSMKPPLYEVEPSIMQELLKLGWSKSNKDYYDIDLQQWIHMCAVSNHSEILSAALSKAVEECMFAEQYAGFVTKLARKLPKSVWNKAELRSLVEKTLNMINDRLKQGYVQTPNFSCSCTDCAGVKKFIFDAKQQVYKLKQKEPGRKHVEQSLRGFPVVNTVDRTHRPFTLVITKGRPLYSNWTDEQKALKELQRCIEDTIIISPPSTEDSTSGSLPPKQSSPPKTANKPIANDKCVIDLT